MAKFDSAVSEKIISLKMSNLYHKLQGNYGCHCLIAGVSLFAIPAAV